MADSEKPVISDLQMLRNQLKSACLERLTSTDTTNRAIGRIWLNTTANQQRIYFDIVNTGSDPAIPVPRLDLDETVSGTWNFNPGGAPFTVGSDDKVINLNADLLDGYDSSQTATASTVAVRYDGGRLRVGTPSEDTDAANKSWVLGQLEHRTFKAPVRVATTINLPDNSYSNGTDGVGSTLTADSNGSINDEVTESGNTLSPIDGVDLVMGDRVLVKFEGGGDSETTNRKNGIYAVSIVGDADTAWQLTRTEDADSANDLFSGASVFVTSGDTNADTIWSIIEPNDDITIGTTGIKWGQISSLSELEAGDGLQKIGRILSIKLTTPSGTIHSQTNPANALSVESEGANLKYLHSLNSNNIGFRERIKYDRYGRVTDSARLTQAGQGIVVCRGEQSVAGQNEYELRSIQGDSQVAGEPNTIIVSNGTGVDNPTIGIFTGYQGQASIRTLGIVQTGTWNANKIGTLYLESHAHKASDIGNLSTSEPEEDLAADAVNIFSSADRTFGGAATAEYSFPGPLRAGLEDQPSDAASSEYALVGMRRSGVADTDTTYNRFYAMDSGKVREAIDVLNEEEILARIGNRAIHGSLALSKDTALRNDEYFTDRNALLNDFTLSITLIIHRQPNGTERLFRAISANGTANPNESDNFGELTILFRTLNTVKYLSVHKRRDGSLSDTYANFMKLDDIDIGRPYNLTVVHSRGTLKAFVDGHPSHSPVGDGSSSHNIYDIPDKMKLYFGGAVGNNECFELISTTILNISEDNDEVLRLARSGGVPPCGLREGEPSMLTDFSGTNAEANIGLEGSTDEDDLIRAHNSVIASNIDAGGVEDTMRVDVDSGDTSSGSGFTFRYRREIKAGEEVRVSGRFFIPTSNTYADRIVVRVEGGPSSGWIRTIGDGTKGEWYDFYFVFTMPVDSSEIKFWFAKDENGGAVWGDSAIHTDDRGYFSNLAIGVAGAVGWWDFTEFDPMAIDVHARDKSLNGNYLQISSHVSNRLDAQNISYPQNALYIHAPEDTTHDNEKFIGIYKNTTELFSVRGDGTVRSNQLAVGGQFDEGYALTIGLKGDNALSIRDGTNKYLRVHADSGHSILRMWSNTEEDDSDPAEVYINSSPSNRSYFSGRLGIGTNQGQGSFGNNYLWVNNRYNTANHISDVAVFQSASPHTSMQNPGQIGARIRFVDSRNRGGYFAAGEKRTGGTNSNPTTDDFFEFGTINGNSNTWIGMFRKRRFGLRVAVPLGQIHISEAASGTEPQLLFGKHSTNNRSMSNSTPVGSLMFSSHRLSGTTELETTRGANDGHLWFKRASIRDRQGGTLSLGDREVTRKIPLLYSERIRRTDETDDTRSFVIWHRLNTESVQVTIRETGGERRAVLAEWKLWQRDSAGETPTATELLQQQYDRRNAIEIAVNVTIASNAYEVVVVG